MSKIDPVDLDCMDTKSKIVNLLRVRAREDKEGLTIEEIADTIGEDYHTTYRSLNRSIDKLDHGLSWKRELNIPIVPMIKRYGKKPYRYKWNWTKNRFTYEEDALTKLYNILSKNNIVEQDELNQWYNKSVDALMTLCMLH